MFFDVYYLYLCVPAMLIALWAQMKVNSTFNRYSKLSARRGITAREAAARVLSANGVTGVRIERVQGRLTDHYDPRSNTIRLSDSVDSSTSVAAIGVACHEAGHAVQYAVGYSPIRLRSAIIPITSIGSNLAFPLILLGAFSGSSGFINFGLLLFSLVVFFQLVTLPVEFNASRRAIASLDDSGLLTADELVGARKVLSAAAMTYVAALITAAANLLRLILVFGGRGRRRG